MIVCLSAVREGLAVHGDFVHEDAAVEALQDTLVRAEDCADIRDLEAESGGQGMKTWRGGDDKGMCKANGGFLKACSYFYERWSC